MTADFRADYGADANPIPLKVLEQILMNIPSVQVTPLTPSLVYTSITGAEAAHFSKKDAIDAYLKIGQRSSFLRNIFWTVPAETMPCLILGKPVLKSIGCDKKKMPEVACERNSGSIDVKRA